MGVFSKILGITLKKTIRLNYNSTTYHKILLIAYFIYYFFSYYLGINLYEIKNNKNCYFRHLCYFNEYVYLCRDIFSPNIFTADIFSWIFLPDIRQKIPKIQCIFTILLSEKIMNSLT